MFSVFTHVMKPVRDTNSEPGLPLICIQQNFFGLTRSQYPSMFSAWSFLLELFQVSKLLHYIWYNKSTFPDLPQFCYAQSPNRIVVLVALPFFSLSTLTWSPSLSDHNISSPLSSLRLLPNFTCWIWAAGRSMFAKCQIFPRSPVKAPTIVLCEPVSLRTRKVPTEDPYMW